MVTHEARAAAIADRVLFLADGLIVRELPRQPAATRSAGDERARTPRDRVALKGLLGRKLRAALTAVAIVLGVAMVSGTYVLTDSIDKRVRLDLHRRLPGHRRRRHRQARVRRRATAARRAPSVRRVAAAEGAARCPDVADGERRRRRRGAARRAGRQGDRLRRRAEPRRSASTRRGPRFNPLTLVAGRWPGPNEVVDRPVDGRSKEHLQVGQTIGVQAEGPVAAAPHLRDRQVRRGLARSAARRSRASTCRPRSGSSTSRASSTRSASPRSRASRPQQLVEQIRADPAAGHAGAHRRGRRPSRTRRTRTSSSRFLQDFLLAFGGIALFVGALRDREHALDHDRAADARVRDAADARRVAAAGARARSSSRRS